MVAPYPKRFDIYWINLDPTIGAEVKKTRPCVVISPDSMNKGLHTVIIAPLTSTLKQWPFRIAVTHKKKKGQMMLDQLRVVSKQRLHKVDGRISSAAQSSITAILGEMFAL